MKKLKDLLKESQELDFYKVQEIQELEEDIIKLKFNRNF